MYRAPEHSEVGFNEKVSVYALGVVLFFMISGELPFYECPTCEEEAALDLTGKHWSYVSDATKQMLTKMLSFEPDSRPQLDDLKM